MGGSGSGSRYHWWRPEKKAVVEDCLSIDANRWRREGILGGGVHLTGSWRWTYRSGSGFAVNYEVRTLDAGNPILRLSYSWTWGGKGAVESADYHVRLATTRPRIGGSRWWFVCPLVGSGPPCSRRVGKLYLPPRSRYFGCRHCHGLTYTSCQESRKCDGLARILARNMGCDFAEAKRALKGVARKRR